MAEVPELPARDQALESRLLRKGIYLDVVSMSGDRLLRILIDEVLDMQISELSSLFPPSFRTEADCIEYIMAGSILDSSASLASLPLPEQGAGFSQLD